MHDGADGDEQRQAGVGRGAEARGRPRTGHRGGRSDREVAHASGRGVLLRLPHGG
jgi:hypothetical protein